MSEEKKVDPAPPTPRVRPSWDAYFMGIAESVSLRATCSRLHVGCVIVRARQILSTGYNGAVRGLDHCDDVGHDMVEGHCVRVVHAEANAIAQSARHGVKVDGAWGYVTAMPCWPCFRLLANAGIVRVIYKKAYRPDERVLKAATRLGIDLVDLSTIGSAE